MKAAGLIERLNFMTTEPDSDAAPMIGPHEDRELELMLAGLKPLAMFYALDFEDWIIPEEDFAPHVAAGRFIKAEHFFPFDTPPGARVRYVFYAVPEEQQRIAQAVEIVRSIYIKLETPYDDQDRLLGRLLGYREEDIEFFLRQPKIGPNNFP
jgi:hypothetical protein